MNNKISITKTDFSGIKQNLIEFLKTQEEFNSFNFEGSALNVLMDILAYNTFYNAYYNNITVNEMFMSSASKRSSIISLAKHFGYFPRTITASTCVVEIKTNISNSNNYYIPKYTTFITNLNNITYPFVVMNDVYFTNNEEENYRTSGPVILKQGKLKKYSFVYDYNNFNKKFIIPYSNVDSSTLVVKVQPDPSSTEEILFKKVSDITKTTDTDNVYFLQQTEDDKLEIFFGDDVFGKKLQDSSIIRIEILQTEGKSANDIGTNNSSSTFNISQSDFSSFSGETVSLETFTIEVLQPSHGGTDRESNDSIKINSTRTYTSSERAVTKDDYKNIILRDNPEIGDVIVWGGEENEPPDYGKVFLSVKPISDSSLSEIEKNNIISNLINNRNIVGVRLEIVDPNVIYLNIEISVNIDPIVISNTTNIQTLIRENVIDFFVDNLKKFDKDYYNSELVEKIQNIDPSIISNTIKIKLSKEFFPNLGVQKNYLIEFDNSITNLKSNAFGYNDITQTPRNCMIEDDGMGNIGLFYMLTNEKVYINKKIGTINYKTGKVELQNFKPEFFINNLPIIIECVPTEEDVVAKRKTVLDFDENSNDSIKINETYIPYKNK